jgi:hypothetical protein
MDTRLISHENPSMKSIRLDLTLEEKDTQRGMMGKQKTNRLGCNETTKKIYVHCLICLALFGLNIPFGQAREEEAGRYQLRDGLRKGQGRAKGTGRKTREALVDILKEAGSQTWTGWDETRELAAFFPPPANTVRNLKGKTSPGNTSRKLKGKKVAPTKIARGTPPYYGIGAPHPRPPPAPVRVPVPPPTPKPTTGHPPRGNILTTPPVGPPSGPPSNKPSTGGDRCQLPNLKFLQLTAVPPPIFVNINDPNDQSLGTQYIYNDAVFNQTTFDEIAGSKVSGTCTRIQSRDDNAPQGIQLGAGHCTFTYRLFDGQNTFTFSATGELADSLGGILDISGGSQALVGAYGQIQLVPANLGSDGSFEPEDGDVFLQPLFYLADATIFFPC